MTYIKLPQPYQTLAFALALVGVYSTMPLAKGDPSAPAPSAIPEVSTATRNSLPVSRQSMLGQALTESLLNNNLLVQQPNHWSAIQVSQNPKPTDNEPTGNGSPDSRRGAGSFNREQRPETGTFENSPSDQGAPAPGSRPGAGSRGGHSCPRVDKPLTPLMPVTPKTLSRGQEPTLDQEPTLEEPASEPSLGLTVADHPTFWFYLPFPLTDQHPIEFVLQDDKGNDIHQTTFTQPGTSAGIAGLKLPSTAPPLEVNKTYRWYFSVYCTSDRTDDPIVAEGLVKRVPINSSLRRQLEQAKPQKRFQLYAKAGLWYEAVTSLAELLRKNPNDVTLKNEWTTLLQAMNLEAIAKEPITSMLSPEK